jgi:hypothetical protein
MGNGKNRVLAHESWTCTLCFPQKVQGFGEASKAKHLREVHKLSRGDTNRGRIGRRPKHFKVYTGKTSA